jgi:hypothetical protein
MIVTLSERTTTELVRELEGLDPAITVEELTERMPQYSQRLFAHLRNFGLTYDGRCNPRGPVADFGFSLKQNSVQDERQTLVDGLAMLRPICISVEREDLPSLILNPMVLAATVEQWPQIAGQFRKVLPSEVLDRIERIAGKVAFSPRPFDPYVDSMTGDPELDAQVWFQMNGVKDPSRNRVLRERAAAAAEKERADALQKQWDRLDPDSRNEDSSWGVREL